MNPRLPQPNSSSRWSDVALQPVPETVQTVLQMRGLDPPFIKLCVSSQLTVSGRFGESWLAVGDQKLAVLEKNGAGFQITRDIRLKDVDAVHIRKVTGGGILVLGVEGRQQDLLRFDLSRSALFSGLAAQLRRTLKKRDSSEVPSLGAVPETAEEKKELSFEHLLKKHREEYCPSCSRPFPKHTKVCPLCLQRGPVLNRILAYTKRHVRGIVSMGCLMVLGVLLELVRPQLLKFLIDDVLKNPNRAEWVLRLAGALALLMALQHGIQIVRARIAIFVGCHITNRIQTDAFNQLQRLSMSFFNRHQTGSLMSRLNNDTRQMQGFLVDGIQFTVINLLMVIGVSAMLIWMNPFLGLLVLLPMPFVVMLSKWLLPRMMHRWHVVWISMSSVSGYLNDVLSGMRVVKAFGQEDNEIDRYDKKLGRTRDHLIAAENTWESSIPILNFLFQTSLVLVWYFGAFEVYAERLTVGGLVAYVSYLGMLFGPLQLITRLNDWLGRSLTAAARVFEILDTDPEIQDKPDARQMCAIEGRVELKGVTFGYEPHNPVLKDVSLEVAPGEMIGLVGPSGAGKSTLINLVGRLYDVDQGTIAIDGIDIRDIRTEDLRRQIGYVLQDSFLFSGTVAENVAYARPDASRKDVIEAAVAANAHEFVMKLPDGYDTLVGERGQRLSGGERQRIAIARAILADAKILVLDEATASVDTETEAKIQHALGRLVKGRTTLAIAHRLSTLRHANRLIVLDNGKIAEQGTHAELMAKEGGVYRRLVEIQTEWSRTMAVGG